MNDTVSKNLILEYTTRLGDDALVLGHRLSEWCSNGPFLEEDLALQNTALDYIGRARMYYSYAAKISDNGKTEDDFAFNRDQREFRNLLIYELPRGDFAHTMVRQLIIDSYNMQYLARLCESKDETLSAIAAKAIKESRYHLRRSQDWVIRLGDGTAESHARAQSALDDLWGYTHEMFKSDESELTLANASIAVDNQHLKDAWKQQMIKTLTTATLQVPTDSWQVNGGREGYHTENLGHLLNEMQSVHRAYPGVKW